MDRIECSASLILELRTDWKRNKLAVVELLGFLPVLGLTGLEEITTWTLT